MAESEAPPASGPGDPWRPHWTSQAAHLVLLVGAAGAVFVAGRVHEGHFGVFLVLAGIALLLFAPRTRVDWGIVGIALALLLACSLAMLPQSWLPAPEWRQRLSGTAFPAAFSVTPTPRETLYWICIAAVAVCVTLFGLAHPLGTRGLFVVALAAMLVCGIYAGLAVFARQTGWEYPLAFDPAAFGFLPNRNHTATFLVTGCTLALGVLGVAVRGRDWLVVALAAASLAVGVVGLLFFSSSRGGIVFLFAGALLWFAGLGKAHRSMPLLISFGAIFAAGCLLFFASTSAVLDRFAGLIRAPAADALPTDGRIAIFRDTLSLIRDFPLTGSGLGTFRYTFRFHGKESLGLAPAVHPESDWLMLAAEAGLPALIVLAVGIGWLIRRVWRTRDHPSWPLRWAILSAAFAAFLHGFVDAPAHRTALGWWILVLFLIGFQTAPREPLRRSRIQHLLLLAGGLGALVLGVQLIRAEWFGGRPSAPYAGFVAEPEIIELRLDGKVSEAAAAARRAIAISPMTDRLYFQLGAALLEQGKNEAQDVLAVQRLINPSPPSVCVEQGFLWIDIAPAKTAELWLEAVERRARIDAARREPRGAVALYRDLVRNSESKPEVQRRLLDASARGIEFTLVWLESAAPGLVADKLSRLAGDARFVSSLDEAGRRRFLRIWYERGSRPALVAFLANRPDWDAAAWQVRAREMVDSGKFEEAVKSVARHHKLDLDLPPAGGTQSGPVDEANPAPAFDAYWRRGNVVAARRVLDEARQGSRDPEVWRLSAALAASDGRWQAAWEHLERCLQHSGLDSVR